MQQRVGLTCVKNCWKHLKCGRGGGCWKSVGRKWRTITKRLIAYVPRKLGAYWKRFDAGSMVAWGSSEVWKLSPWHYMEKYEEEGYARHEKDKVWSRKVWGRKRIKLVKYITVIKFLNIICIPLWELAKSYFNFSSFSCTVTEFHETCKLYA